MPRPSTASGGTLGVSSSSAATKSESKVANSASHGSATPVGLPSGVKIVEGKVLRLTFLSTWGDMNYFGLSGLQLIDDKGLPLSLTIEQLQASPSDLNERSGGSDPRTVDKLLDQVNNTTDSWHMWLAPWLENEGVTHTLTITLHHTTRLAAIRVWNYNKSIEDSHRGVQVKCLSTQSVLSTKLHNIKAAEPHASPMGLQLEQAFPVSLAQ